MKIIPLKNIPNQEFSTVQDDNQWNISVRLVAGAIAVSLSCNGVEIVTNARAVAGMRILQSIHQQNGNFAIATNNQEIPDYTKFQITQFLIYISPAELAVSQAPPSDRVPEVYFDPIAPLPLRFEPQGYSLAVS